MHADPPAGERRQGGAPDALPVPIAHHPGVRRRLIEIDADAALLTALTLEAAVTLDAGGAGGSASAALAVCLRPTAKTFGGEPGFAAASGAIRVLGGAGCTREGTAGRDLRDARILTISEGARGMQVQDFLFRRLAREEGAGLDAFLARARAERTAPGEAPAAIPLDRFEALSRSLAARGVENLAAAHGCLRAGRGAVGAVLASRPCRLGGAPEPAGRHWLAMSHARTGLAEAMTG